MTPDLDWKLRSAADGLLRATANVPVGSAPTPPRRPRRIAAVTLLIAAVVGGGFLIWKGDRNREPRVTTGPVPVDVSPLVLDPPPPGMTAVSATDLPAAPDETSPGLMSLTLYRGTLAFDGNAAVDLGVVVVTDETLRSGGDPVLVRGHEGEVHDAGPFGGPTVTWEEAPDLEITLASQTLDTALLLEIAEGVQVIETPADTAVELGRLPDAIAGLGPVAEVEDMDISGMVGVSQSSRGHVVEYEGDTGVVVLAVVEGSVKTLDVMTWAIGAEQSHDAGGRTVSTAEVPGDDGTTTYRAGVWLEDGGAVGYAVASNVTEAELLDLLTGNLRVASTEEWEGVIDETRP